MNYSIELSDNFKKEAKRLVKKYRSLKSEIAALVDELETDPTKGTPLGNDIYKIRLAFASKGKVNPAEQGSCPWYKSPKPPLSFFPSTTKAIKTISLIRKFKSLSMTWNKKPGLCQAFIAHIIFYCLKPLWRAIVSRNFILHLILFQFAILLFFSFACLLSLYHSHTVPNVLEWKDQRRASDLYLNQAF